MKDFFRYRLPYIAFCVIPIGFVIYVIGAAAVDVHYELEAKRKRSQEVEHIRIINRGKARKRLAESEKNSKKDNAAKKNQSSVKSSGSSYSDYEDFYYDNEEDFDSLDDAEDYYNEYYSDY